MYKSSDKYIAGCISSAHLERRDLARLKVKLADMLTGPVCRNTAEELAQRMVSGSNDPEELASFMNECSKEYLQAIRGE